MKSPRMLRLLFVFGILAISLAVFTYLTNPVWRSSPVGILILLSVVGIGIAAVVKDLRDLSRELKSLENKDRSKQ